MNKLRTPLWDADKTPSVYAKAVREALSMNQTEMGELLGVGTAYVSHMETGTREVKRYMLMAYQWVEHVNQPSIKMLAKIQTWSLP